MASPAKPEIQQTAHTEDEPLPTPEPATIARFIPNPSSVQRSWLARGLRQPGGKLPLFDEGGQRINPRTIQSCIEQGWAEPWYANPLKPDWLVCKLTEQGRAAALGQ